MRYKLYLSLLAGLVASTSLSAEPVSRREALKIAQRYVQVDERSELRNLNALETSGVQPAYHIINDAQGKGFVIISGDDALPPLLGYADAGKASTSDMPVQLKELLRIYEQRVGQLRSAGTTIGRKADQLPSRYPKVIVAPLTKSRWNQDKPYNEMTPKNAPTGCLATAVAQIMYFHQWPEQGKGSHTYQPVYKQKGSSTYYYDKQTVDFSQSTYAWSDMKPVYTYNSRREKMWTEDEAKAVAHLMYDVGVSVEMQYTPQASGAYTHKAAEALMKNFDYSVKYLMRDYTHNASTLQSVQAELELGYPVLMGGASPGGGHAFIIDGYDSNGFLHVNWGWGGMSDGYYALDLMNPEGLGIGGGAGQFSHGQSFLFMRPNKDNMPAIPVEDRLSFYDGQMRLMSSKTNWAEKKVRVNLSKIMNLNAEPYKGRIGVAVYDSQGTQKHVYHSERVYGPVAFLAYATGGQNFDLNLSNLTLTDGDYRLIAVCQRQDEANPEKKFDWLEIGKGNYITFKVKDGAMSFVSDGQKVGLTMQKPPRLLSRLHVGRPGSIHLAFTNESPYQLDGSIGLLVKNEKMQQPDTIKLENTLFYDYYTIEQPYEFHHGLSAGTYDVSFCFITDPVLDEYGRVDEPSMTLDIDNPFGDFKLVVNSAEGKPVLETYNSNGEVVTIKHNGQAVASDELDMAQLKDGKLTIGVNLFNYGGTEYTGRIRYSLVNMDSEELAEDGVSRRKRFVGETGDIDIPRFRKKSVNQTEVTIVPSNLKLQPNHRYELQIEAYIDDEWVDIWSSSVKRIYFTLLNTDVLPEPDGTSVQTIEDEQAVYPNPCRGTLFVAQGYSCIDLFDLAGRRVLSEQTAEGKGQINVAHLPAGVYVARVQSAAGYRTARLIIE